MGLLTEIFSINESNISLLNIKSLAIICSYLDINTSFYLSSELSKNNELKAEDRVIDINKTLNSTQYINPIGGTALYDKEKFMNNNINLSFLKSNSITYKQFGTDFVSWLSIIDVLMFNDREKVIDFLELYELV